MEYINVMEAAKLCEVSDKTIRRAVDAGKLKAQDRVHKNEPLMIERSSLNDYITSRQSVQTCRLEPEPVVQDQRLEALEQRIQQLEEQNIEQQKRIEALEKRLTVPDRPVAKTKISAKQDTVFTLADFSIGWKDCYKSTAVQGDIHAGIELRLCSQAAPGQYMRTGYADKIKPRGSISEAQKARSDALYEILKQQMLEAMQAAGWKEDGKLGTRQLYRKVNC